MCDFKPGDEVVYVGGGTNPELRQSGVKPNSVHTVKKIAVIGGYPSVWIDAHDWWICSSSFRKVQRRNLTEWLNTSVGSTDKLDKRQKAGVRA